MTDRRMRILLEVDAVITDDTWTIEDLRDNAVMYLEAIIDDAEADRVARFPGDSAYRLETQDATVFLAEDYCEEVREADTAGLGPIAALPPAERRKFWFGA